MPARRIDASNPRHSHFWLSSYAQMVRIINLALASGVQPATAVCVTIVQTLAAMFTDKSVGVYLAVDGTAIAANVAQISCGNGPDKEQVEAHLRRRHPHAGFRVLSKRKFSDGEGLSHTASRVVRGYNFVTVSDALTGLPLVGKLYDANALGNESWSLPELLTDLFTKWPKCPAKYIVGDGAWDVEDAVEFAMRRYGIALIARRTKKNSDAIIPVPGKKTIAWITGRGEAFCRRHGAQMRWVGVEVPDRKGMTPGVELDASLYRVRYDSDCCGRASVRMSLNWSALSPLPHTPYGRPNLHARRIALYGARNTSEAINASLKMGHGQGLAGSYRTRLNNMQAVEGLLWLTLAMRALFQLRAVR